MATIGTMEARAPLGQYNYQRNFDANVPNMSKSSVSSRSTSISSKASAAGDGTKQQAALVQIEEIRKSKEVDETTGMPKYTSVHRYLKGKMLGKGGFAKVYWAQVTETKKPYAIKIVPKANIVKARARQKLQAEIRIHRTLRHANICGFKHFFEDNVNCYILLELCENQSMNELLKRRKRLTEPEVLYYMTQIVTGTKYMHSINVIHRDLKLGNLFLDSNMCVKIGDLGLAAKLDHADERRKTICGTPNYIAPEIIDGKNKQVGHSFPVDLWSTGVIMFALLCGKPPFESKDVKSTYRRILDNSYSFPENCNVSDNSRDVIQSLLRTKPDERMSLDDILSHPALDCRRSFIPDSLPVSALREVPVWTNLLRENANVNRSSKPRSKSKSTAHFKALQQSHCATNNNEFSKPLVRRAFSSYDMNRVVDVDPEISTKGPVIKKSVSVARSLTSSIPTNHQMSRRNSSTRTSTRRKPSTFEIYSDGKENRVTLSPENTHDTDDQREDFQPVTRNIHRAPPLRSSSSTTLLRRLSSNDSNNDINDVTAKTAAISLHEERREGPSTKLTFQQRSVSSFSSTISSSSKSKSQSKAVSLIPPSIQIDTKKSSTQSQSTSTTKCVAADVDIEVLESMHMRLVRAEKIRNGEVTASNMFTSMSPQPNKKSAEKDKATKWVSRYVDYTSKYGLGFLLNDGSSGVCFNDSTKAVLSPNNDTFHYIERRRSHQSNVIPEHHTLSNHNYPEALEKKVLLLKHFRNYLMEQQKKHEQTQTQTSDRTKENTDTDDNAGEDVEEDPVYVKKWVRTRHAILFRLSDRTVQVVFFDHTEVILSAGARLVTYVDKMNNRTTFPLNSIATSTSTATDGNMADFDFDQNSNFQAEIAKRLRYAKDIMHQLITTSTNVASSSNTCTSNGNAPNAVALASTLA
uniref:Serine/threonine-protein kinase PLK n=1 Tax=Leptocylindrus danicus TaxID=163516 RepID=A0A7S2PIT0_9STRA|mmetsp:Transcript_34064/g.49377  ORF Transcript_34064/g.49377 Transcript_34064/m.49377 type:complete len:919 (+) Transcript_34064:3302-6058(+)|eukprot:CAMPEP_0116031392 /NCGR_PEP_ID=MMETSP0321-20121206/17479_1 /TAXON_ID=163516 /ORGANISM="Leptocylindrus danicus var. danicus, Strain B650" /LENGTH=918 /DNA_ID=CAMNT_0003506493 /DNA_START=193 /DNA_END=2949 /DNA_ORIENTATION=-